MKPDLIRGTALSAAMGLVTEPLLTLEIEGEEFSFMVDTGAMVSLIQPGISKAQLRLCDVQARVITGTQLDILGEQEINFKLYDKGEHMNFVHTFVVSPLKRCSSDILGMDFLQRVGAGISLTTQSLRIGQLSFPLKNQGQEIHETRYLINTERAGSLNHNSEEWKDEPDEDWEGTVELVGAVTVPPLSARIARCRVVRRDDSMANVNDKVPRQQVVLIEPEGLPRILMARIVATLSNCDASNASGLGPPVVGKSPLVIERISPCETVVPEIIDDTFVTDSIDGFLKVGAGECLSELPDSGSRVVTTSLEKDLQAVVSSLPVENVYDNQVDTLKINAAQIGTKGLEKLPQDRENKGYSSIKNKGKNIQQRTQVLGYVPIQIVNLSLEEVDIEAGNYIGVASPIQVEETQEHKGYNVNTVKRVNSAKQDSFDAYLREKLAHIKGEDRSMLENALRRYKHLFYGLNSEELGCTSQVEHSIETGDARPIKQNPYRIPYALKPVVDEHIEEMLDKEIIEPSMSPWSSSIVLVRKKSRDGSAKYRFCIDY